MHRTSAVVGLVRLWGDSLLRSAASAKEIDERPKLRGRLRATRIIEKEAWEWRAELVEHGDQLAISVISPGVTESELADTISDATVRATVNDFRKIAIPADAIARAIAYAIDQPDDVDVSEVIVRPTASPH